MPWDTPPRTTRTQDAAWAHTVLTRAGYTCEIQGPGCTGTATEADHRTPTSEGGPALDPDNGQATCPACHRAKTRREIARGRARYYGSTRRPPEPHPTDPRR